MPHYPAASWEVVGVEEFRAECFLENVPIFIAGAMHSVLVRVSRVRGTRVRRPRGGFVVSCPLR